MKTILVAINAKYIHTNLAVRYLYTFNKDNNDIDFIEFTIKDSTNKIIDDILKFKPDLIGFSCYIWNIEYIKEIVIKIKSLNKDVKILLGGPEASYDINQWFNDLPIDFIISGEGEYPLKKLLDTLNKKNTFENVPQLHYRQNNNIYSNNNEFVIDLNILQTPYRLPRDLNKIKNRIQYIESSRGCPYKCSYCLASLENNIRFFNIDFIKNEIRYLMNNGAKTFKFLDRTFNLRKEYAIEMFKFIINEHKENCVFQFEISGDLLDEEVICYLNENAPIGLIRFEIGIQSTNEITNKLILRKQDFNKLKRNILLIQEGKKIDLHLDLIAGLPKEDYNSFVKTFNDVFSLFPHELQLGFLKMLRGTKIRNEANIYNYKFSETAPYEIIENSDISTNDIYKIHLAEDILEKYYNSHRFESTINYIINIYYKNNNYKFFEKYGVFYNNNYSSINYQYHDLCIRLLDFCKIDNLNIDNIESLLIYDYLKKQKTRPKIWFKTNVNKDEKHIVFKYMIESMKLDFNYDFLFRYVFVHKLLINPEDFKLGNYYLIKFFSEKNNNTLIIKI